MALTSEQELIKQYEFQKFQVKMKMTAREIKEAVIEDEYNYTKDNSDILWELISEIHDKRNLSDDDYLNLYMDNIHEENALRDQLYKEATNGTNE